MQDIFILQSVRFKKSQSRKLGYPHIFIFVDWM